MSNRCSNSHNWCIITQTMKYSITSGECYSPKSPQVVIFPPRFPKQEPFNTNTDPKQLYATGNRFSGDVERNTIQSSDPYMQIDSGNANLQSASTADLISQGSQVAAETYFRPNSLELPRHNNRRHKMARIDSRKRNKESESSAYSEESLNREFASKRPIYIAVAIALLAIAMAAISVAMMLQLISKCDDLERKLNSAHTSYSLAQQDAHTCLPCGELALGPFDDENEEVKLLISKEENGVKTCCAKTASQLSIMLNLFAKRKKLEACSQESLLRENLTSACNNASVPVSAPVKPNGSISAHLVVGNRPVGNDEIFQPIRQWKHGYPGAHLSNINVTAENSRIVVPETGVYFLYSQVGYLLYYDVATEKTSTSQSLFHVVYRFNAIYPLDGTEELLRSVVTQCWEKNKDYGRYTSYVGAALKLNKGDQLYVKVSNAQSVDKRASITYFGLYKIN